MPAEIAEAVDRALDGVSDSNIDPLVATGVAVATGQLDRATLDRKVQQASGATPEEAASRVQAAAKSLRDVRVAEVTKLDMKIEGGNVVAYRAKVSLSFKYDA
jgi:flavin-binding protein dodecin